MRGKDDRPKKRIRKQKYYHSSSDESDEAAEQDFAPVSLADDAQSPDDESQQNNEEVDGTDASTAGQSNSSEEEDSSSLHSDEQGEAGIQIKGTRKKTSKRNDPDAFSTSISKILSSKLSQGARKDPVLSRSREAAEVSSGIANERLERRAKAKIRADRKDDLERGRVKDVLGLQSGMAGEMAEEEKKLRKIAQRGVVKLFNAVRAAQVKGEEAAKEARKEGTVGYANREVKITEMSKQGFLDLINGNGKSRLIEEAR